MCAASHVTFFFLKRYRAGGGEDMGTVLDIKIKRANKVYKEGELLSGVVVVVSKDTVQHQGIFLTMEGSVSLQLSAKSVGVFEAFYNSVKYTLRCDMKRSLLAKDLTKNCEFIIHSQPQKGKQSPSPVDFTITPETLQNVKERASLPRFLIRGHLDSSNCVITQPLTGELMVETSEVAIKSIELQLVRVETCGCAEGYARDATEIQNIQIAEGDVCRGLPIPIYMVFPRLFTCPTLETTNFKIEFEVNIVVVLQDDHLITENFPLKLYRL
ncbi:hypothetical protein GDO81_007006 [Engystomops pustulosus]|uniref:VPS26 endosomal protein sorting factor C n=1 Tax=Engystomops pustulosus TaxID=76066 RepID=A0AAV7D2L7_ENGPU|nr:hypothetical protein GDO81_007006 [Engystomops pustulosus]